MNNLTLNPNFQNLSEKQRSQLMKIQLYAHEILNREFRNRSYDEELDIVSDSESLWYSYVIEINLHPTEVLRINSEFIDNLIEKNQIDLLSSEIVFRFQTGEQ